MNTIPLTAVKRRSALQAFSECRFRWSKVYIDGVINDSRESLRGTAWHACAEQYIRALFAARESQNFDFAKEAFARGIAQAPCPAELLDEIDSLYWRWAEGFELDVDAYLLNEEQPPDPDGYELRIDLAYARGDVLEIKDFKTFYRILPAAEVKRSLQAKFYAARARRIWPGFQTYRFVMVFVRFGVEVPVEFSQAELDRVDSHVAAIEAAQADAVIAAYFPATPGDHCGYCSLPCPEVEKATRLPVRLLKRADAEKAAGELLVLQQAIAARRQALETYTMLEGDVEIGGVRFHHKPVETTKFSAAAVVDALRAQDIVPIFSVGTTAVRPFLTAKKWAHVKPAIERLAQKKTSSRFTIARSTAPDDAEETED